MPSLRVLSVVSEIFPLVKTGGLADVAGALPKALAREGVAVTSLVPGYPAVIKRLESRDEVLAFDDLFGGPATLVAGRAAGLELLVLDAPHLYARAGNPYLGPDGIDWPDNAQRFAALGFVASEIATGALAGFRPGIVHVHDWQGGLALAYLALHEGRRPATVMTIHNLAYQGTFAVSMLAELRLPAALFAVDGIEYYGRIGFLKAGLQYADRITTVSPTYAREILTPENGMGLDGLLRRRADVLSGILNGIDIEVWDPARDSLIAATYDGASDPTRAANVTALREALALADDPSALLVGVVSRLTSQKGLDLLFEAIPALAATGVQIALLGSGDAVLEAAFARAQRSYPGRVGCRFGYDESIAHLIQAGSDAILVPSRFEPCGLTQLYALRYGAIPIVARVGGLADTVIDANEMAIDAGVATGIVFGPPSVETLLAAFERAAHVFADRGTLSRMRENGMAADVSWKRPAARYAALYREIG